MMTQRSRLPVTPHVQTYYTPQSYQADDRRASPHLTVDACARTPFPMTQSAQPAPEAPETTETPEVAAPSPADAAEAMRRARIVEHLRSRSWATLVSMFDENEGEITDATDELEATLADLAEEHKELLGEAYLGLMAWADTIKTEEARLATRRKRLEEMADKIPGMVKITKTVETPLVTFKLTTSKAWIDAEGDDVPPLEFADERFVKHVPESWKADRTALKKHALAADKEAAKLEKKANRKRNPQEATKSELAELAELQAVAENARKFGHVETRKNVKISRSS